MQSLRLVGNIGARHPGDPTEGHRQNDVLTYGVSFARALTRQRNSSARSTAASNLRSAVPCRAPRAADCSSSAAATPLHGPLRFDAAVVFGLTEIDPPFGFTGGFTYVFNAFTVP